MLVGLRVPSNQMLIKSYMPQASHCGKDGVLEPMCLTGHGSDIKTREHHAAPCLRPLSHALPHMA